MYEPPTNPGASTMTLRRRLDPKQQASRAAVVEAARTLIAERGHEEVTMGHVATLSGVSRATLYRYFASKEHVVAEAVLSWGEDFLSKHMSSSANDLDVWLAATVRQSAANREMVRATVASVFDSGPAGEDFRNAIRVRVAQVTGDSLELERWGTLVRVALVNLALLAVGDVDVDTCMRQLRADAKPALASFGAGTPFPA